MITQKELKFVLNYNPGTGIFTWLVDRNWKIKKGSIAGSINGAEYVQITIYRNVYLAHRLAYLFMNGEWPENYIDHRNTIRADNRWMNLRDATNRQNSYNSGVRAKNKTGHKGVRECHNKYRADIRAGGKVVFLGSFDTVEEASEAYQKKATELHGAFLHSQ